jgi:hypothetical protein
MKGFSLFQHWRHLSLKDKLRSTIGTARRILFRKLFRPLKLNSTNVNY